MRRFLRRARLRKADLWAVVAVLGLMALSVPSLNETPRQKKQDEIVSSLKTGSASLYQKVAAHFSISKN